MADSDDEQELSREAAEGAAAAARASEQSMRADLQMLQAKRYAGKPGGERPRVAAVPPSLALRKEDAELDDALDHLTDEDEVRRQVEDFNERITEIDDSARPSLTTAPRDVDATVAAWRERYDAFRAVPRAEADAEPPKRHWWNRLNRR